MYIMYTIRTVFMAILYIASWYGIEKSHIKNKRKWLMISGILVIILWVLSPFVLVENLFYTFKTPEAAFEYWQPDVEKILLVAEGKESAFLVAQEDANTLTIGIAVRADNGWKLASPFDYSCLQDEYSESGGVEVYQYKDTGDYYVSADSFGGEYYEISDNKNSEFSYTSIKNDTIGYTRHLYLGYVPDIDENYVVSINGEEFLKMCDAY